MLFTTAAFTMVYLPLVILVFFLVAHRSHYWAAASLFIASLIFYSFASIELTVLLVVSMTANFAIGTRISKSLNPSHARLWLILGISVDLAALAYFKYAGFLVDNLVRPLIADISFQPHALPVGISFYTFTQIAFLVDTYQKGVKEYRPIHYGLFVTFFPHLIAGPVLHHAQMMPQFREAKTYAFSSINFAAGIAIFLLGLFKKVIIADGISPYADAVFNAAHSNQALTMAEGWIGALAYTLQLYFDFSGYSDMAIGLSWMLNIRLPYNFNSPYKARNISDFWRRWHISLSTFLRDYLYIALGGNRHGKTRRYLNLFITMLLGGLWHGASWTFVFWGGLHGVYLMINLGWNAMVKQPLFTSKASRLLGSGASWAVTFLAVVVGWVFFRAPSFSTAGNVLHAMFGGATSLSPQHNAVLWNAGFHAGTIAVLISMLLACVMLIQNSNQIGEKFHQLVAEHRDLRIISIGACTCLIVTLILINEYRSAVSAFIYFNF